MTLLYAQRLTARTKKKLSVTYTVTLAQRKILTYSLYSTKGATMLNEYFAVFTLNGNFKLVENLLDSHELEIVFYCKSLEEAKAEFKAHKKFLKAEGLL